MTSFSRPALTLALLGVLVLACGDDDTDPVTAHDPCDDANTTCLALQANADEMTYVEEYEVLSLSTRHAMTWNAGTESLSNYGPGRRILVTVTFNPPIEVRYDHSHRFLFFAGPTGNFDKIGYPTTSAHGQGWTSTDVWAECLGVTGANAAQFVEEVDFYPVATGEKLTTVTFEVTIPETYAGGDPVLAGDLGPISFGLYANLSGNTTGNPPAWPEGHPLP